MAPAESPAITEILRMEGDVITLQDIFKFQQDEITADGAVVGAACGRRVCGPPSSTSSSGTASRCTPASSRRTAITRGRSLEWCADEQEAEPVRRPRPPARRVVPAGTCSRPSRRVAQSRPGDADFPDRSYVLTLPEHTRLDKGTCRSRENGRRSAGCASLRSAPHGPRLGVVLAVDTSASMHGAPLRRHSTPRGRSRARRNERQPLALVTFGTDSRVALPFTTDPVQDPAPCRDPVPAAGGTHLYDAATPRRRARPRAPAFRAASSSCCPTEQTTAARPTAKALGAAARRPTCASTTVGLRSSRFDPVAPAGWPRPAAAILRGRRRRRSWSGSTARSAPSSRTATWSAIGRSPARSRRSTFGPRWTGLGTASTLVPRPGSDVARRRRRRAQRMELAALDRARGGWSSSACSGLRCCPPVVAGSRRRASGSRSSFPLARGGPVGAVPHRASRGRRRALAVQGRLVGWLRDRGRRRGHPLIARPGRRGRRASRRSASESCWRRPRGSAALSRGRSWLAPLPWRLIVHRPRGASAAPLRGPACGPPLGGRRLPAGRSQLPRRAGGGTRRGSRARAGGVRPRDGRRAPGPPARGRPRVGRATDEQSRGRTCRAAGQAPARSGRRRGRDGRSGRGPPSASAKSCAARCAR